MPWAIAIRWLVRLAAGLIFWRLAAGRRRAFAPGTAGAGRGPSLHHFDPEATAAMIRQSASLAWRLVSAATLAGLTVLLVAGGVTIVVLTPRWLGAVLLGTAVLAGAGAWFEAHRLMEALRARVRGHHDEDLRRTAR